MKEKHCGMTEERWKPIVDYEGWYEVSDLGKTKRVKSGKSTFVGKILKNSKDSWGYCGVGLCKNGEMHSFLVHHLVARAFIGIRPIGKEVNHIDGDKTNNRLDNLEYVIPSENMAHAYRMGLMPTKQGESNGRSKLTKENVHEIRRLTGDETPKDIAARFDVSRSAIYNITSGKTWSHLKEEEENDDNN